MKVYNDLFFFICFVNELREGMKIGYFFNKILSLISIKDIYNQIYFYHHVIKIKAKQRVQHCHLVQLFRIIQLWSFI